MDVNITQTLVNICHMLRHCGNIMWLPQINPENKILGKESISKMSSCFNTLMPGDDNFTPALEFLRHSGKYHFVGR